jgi:predicted ATPase
MLDALHLASFKCFETLDLPLGTLTVLSGINGGGKSSVIQSLVLLAQTLDEREWSKSLLLNGPSLTLGNASDVINQTTGRRQLSLGASAGKRKVVWTFRARDRRAMALDLSAVEVDGDALDVSGPIRWLLPEAEASDCAIVKHLRSISWLSAERTGPRELLPLLDAEHHRRVGMRGELAAGLLHWRESDTVSERLLIVGEPPTLFHQVRARMRHFFPGCDLQILPIDGASAVSLRLRSNAKSDFQRPQNVGFGLTQLFPVLVEVLAARPGDVVIVENPEVHLHPKAQQDIGELLALVASCGVQVIVETHSDHVLNGIRLAVKAGGAVQPSQVEIHFFSTDADGASRRLSPRIDAHGRLDVWPEGFFDQFDQALALLL